VSATVDDPRVAAALAEAVGLGEHAVQVAAYLGDELIVDSTVGPADGESLFPVFSVSKAVTATAVHVQAERGLIDYEAPIADYWPEYGTHGKESVTVRHVLTHRAGVPEMPPQVTPERLGDWEWMTEQLAGLAPTYPPGSHNTYLSMTFGWILGEVVRRTDPRRRPFGDFIREEICAPLGLESLWIGIPDDRLSQVMQLTYPDPAPLPLRGSLAARAVPPVVELLPEVFNRPDVQRACVPAVGAIANARSLAGVFALLAGGGEFRGRRLLDTERIRSFLEPREGSKEPDETYGSRIPSGTGGYWIVAPGVSRAGPLRGVLCHTGAGGSIGWADLDTGLAAAICHDRMFDMARFAPFASVGDAVRAVAAERMAATP
jgi:CubicO group peptidase (beta-lactamase class C family)